MKAKKTTSAKDRTDFLVTQLSDENYLPLWRKQRATFNAAKTTSMKASPELAAFWEINKQAFDKELHYEGEEAVRARLRLPAPIDPVDTALQNPFTHLRAVMLFNPSWALSQPRIADFVSRLYEQANYGHKGDRLTRECSRLLSSFLVTRTRGAHPLCNRSYVRQWFKAELERLNGIMGVNRKIICSAWNELKEQRHESALKKQVSDEQICGIAILRESMAEHLLTEYGLYVHDTDIEFAVNPRSLGIRAYVVVRTAEQFGVTERAVRDHVKDIR
jgi:hypothetical protein